MTLYDAKAASTLGQMPSTRRGRSAYVLFVSRCRRTNDA